MTWAAVTVIGAVIAVVVASATRMCKRGMYRDVGWDTAFAVSLTMVGLVLTFIGIVGAMSGPRPPDTWCADAGGVKVYGTSCIDADVVIPEPEVTP